MYFYEMLEDSRKYISKRKTGEEFRGKRHRIEKS